MLLFVVIVQEKPPHMYKSYTNVWCTYAPRLSADIEKNTSFVFHPLEVAPSFSRHCCPVFNTSHRFLFFLLFFFRLLFSCENDVIWIRWLFFSQAAFESHVILPRLVEPDPKSVQNLSSIFNVQDLFLLGEIKQELTRNYLKDEKNRESMGSRYPWKCLAEFAIGHAWFNKKFNQS